jgi:Spy/CpxP family protein refolding chaperone
MSSTTKVAKIRQTGLLFLFLLFVPFVVGNLSPRFAAAQPPPALGGPPHRGRPPFDRILERHAERLKLDEATREKIRAIGVETQTEARPIRDQLRESRDEMRRLLGQDIPDEAVVMRQAERIGSLETEMQKQRLRAMLRIRALLTPEQRQELVKIHEERRGRRRGRPDERGPTPPPSPAGD